jgi:hypothetical protein
MKFKKSEDYFTIRFQFSLNHHKIYPPYCLHELINSTNIPSRMEPQACSVHDFLITSGICAFIRGFHAFIREFHTFTRGFRAFTREFHAFTREFGTFTRGFRAFTREFHTLLVNSAYC